MMKKTLLIAGLAGLVGAASSQAAVSFTGSPLLYNFNSFDGNTAPTGWDANGFSDGVGFSEMRGVSAGGETTGGTYAYEVSTGNTALGVQPGGSDFTSGYYQLQVTNNDAAAVTAWDIAFVSYSYNDQARGNSFNFSYSIDGSNFTEVAAGSFTSTAAADTTPAWVVGANYSDTINANVGVGDSLYLRWTGDDVDGSGSRDEFALDDVSIAAIPEPSTALLGGLGILALLRRRR